jgi:hypothetical protein
MAREKVCPPPDYRCEVTLLDGRKALIRAIRPDDQVALLTLFHRLSRKPASCASTVSRQN